MLQQYRSFQHHFPILPLFLYGILSQIGSEYQNVELLTDLLWSTYPVLLIITAVMEAIYSYHHFTEEQPHALKNTRTIYIILRTILALGSFVTVTASAGGLMAQVYQYDFHLASIGTYFTLLVNLLTAWYETKRFGSSHMDLNWAHYLDDSSSM